MVLEGQHHSVNGVSRLLPRPSATHAAMGNLSKTVPVQNSGGRQPGAVARGAGRLSTAA